ncbi:MAG: response regulator [Patescibacteria group bacterium]|nr:response regulator [Patescibacteria group bacterium]
MKENGKKIVIAEDDRFISEMYATKLSAEGFEVEVVNNGKEAVEIVEKIKPDVVLLDIMMPKLDGIEVLKRIRGNKDLKDVSVIVLTNANEKDHVFKSMGVSGYLIKSSFTPDEVVEKIKEKI